MIQYCITSLNDHIDTAQYKEKKKNSYAVFPLGRLPCPVYTLICALAQLLFLESVPSHAIGSTYTSLAKQ